MREQIDSLSKLFKSSLSIYVKKIPQIFGFTFFFTILIFFLLASYDMLTQITGNNYEIIILQFFSGNINYLVGYDLLNILLILAEVIILLSLFLFIVTFMIIFYFYMIYSFIEKTPLKIKESIKSAIKKTPATLYTIILMNILLTILFFLLVIPSLIFTILWFFAIPIVIFSNEKGFKALKKSTKMLYNKWFYTLFVIIGIYASIFLFSILLNFLKGFVYNLIPSMNILPYIDIVFSSLLLLIFFYGLIVLLNYYINFERNSSKDTNFENNSEEMAKNYIEEYRSSYSKQAIQNALTKQIGNEGKVKKYMNKYY